MRGQTNFVRGMMRYTKVYNPEKMLADHARPVRYEIPLPPVTPRRQAGRQAAAMYMHAPRGRAARSIDDATEKFVDETRIGATP